MFEYLESIDRSIVVAINGAHNPFFDEVFWLVSKTLTWIPLYIFILHHVWKADQWRNLLVFLGMASLMVLITDQTSVHLFKNTVLRYRPSHNLLIKDQLHYYVKKNGELYTGGDYGFISSHAVNFFALALFAGMSLRKYYPKMIWILLGAAVIVCYSRIYLGVHYLSDVMCGGAWGAMWGYLFYRIYMKVKLPVQTDS